MKKVFVKSEILSRDKDGNTTNKNLERPEFVARKIPKFEIPSVNKSRPKPTSAVPPMGNKNFMEDDWAQNDYLPPDALTEDDFEYFQFLEREKREKDKKQRLQELEEIKRFKAARNEIVYNDSTIWDFDSTTNTQENNEEVINKSEEDDDDDENGISILSKKKRKPKPIPIKKAIQSTRNNIKSKKNQAHNISSSKQESAQILGKRKHPESSKEQSQTQIEKTDSAKKSNPITDLIKLSSPVPSTKKPEKEDSIFPLISYCSSSNEDN